MRNTLLNILYEWTYKKTLSWLHDIHIYVYVSVLHTYTYMLMLLGIYIIFIYIYINYFHFFNAMQNIASVLLKDLRDGYVWNCNACANAYFCLLKSYAQTLAKNCNRLINQYYKKYNFFFDIFCYLSIFFFYSEYPNAANLFFFDGLGPLHIGIFRFL